MTRAAIMERTEHAGGVRISYRIPAGAVTVTLRMPSREAYEVCDILNGIVSRTAVSDHSIRRAYWIARTLNPAWRSFIYQEPLTKHTAA